MYIKRKNNRETSNIIVFFDLYWIFIMLVAAALCLIFDFIHISRAIQCCSGTQHTHTGETLLQYGQTVGLGAIVLCVSVASHSSWLELVQLKMIRQASRTCVYIVIISKSILQTLKWLATPDRAHSHQWKYICRWPPVGCAFVGHQNQIVNLFSETRQKFLNQCERWQSMIDWPHIRNSAWNHFFFF